LVPVALLLPAELLGLPAELLAVALLLSLELLPVAEHILDLAPQGDLVERHYCRVVRALGRPDLLLHALDLFPGDGLFRPVQRLLEELLRDRQLGILEVVIVR